MDWEIKEEIKQVQAEIYYYIGLCPCLLGYETIEKHPHQMKNMISLKWGFTLGNSKKRILR